MKRFQSLQWLASGPIQGTAKISVAAPLRTQTSSVQDLLPDHARLYPKQVSEVNRAFDRIKMQFISHRETYTILEFVRALVISLGVDRNDTPRILGGASEHYQQSSRGWAGSVGEG